MKSTAFSRTNSNIVQPGQSTSIPLYAQSSQFRNWRYSKEGIGKLRADLNVLAVQRVKSNVEEERAQQTAEPVASTSTLESVSLTPQNSGSGSSTPAPSAAEIQYLTVEDELSLVTFYLSKISQLCAAFRFSEMVEATAMTYLKRFYLRNTCMDYHPKNIMLTSVFLATKTENHPISIDTFTSKTKTQPEDVLSLEFLVSQSLRFEYKVHHAHLAGLGLSLDLQTTDLAQSTIDEVWSKAHKYIKIARLTDVEFIYTPSQIALAAFRLSEPNAIENWLGLKESLQDPSSTNHLEHDLLLECLETIGSIILKSETDGVDTEAVRAVDLRLRWARNPEKDPESALFKKRKSQEEKDLEAARASKASNRIDYQNVALDPFA